MTQRTQARLSAISNLSSQLAIVVLEVAHQNITDLKECFRSKLGSIPLTNLSALMCVMFALASGFQCVKTVLPDLHSKHFGTNPTGNITAWSFSY